MSAYCAYERNGPLLIKGPSGLLVAAFASLDLVKHFLSQMPRAVAPEAVELTKLQSDAYPLPAQWSMVTQALLFDSVATIDHFLKNDRGTFPYGRHTVPLSTLGV